MPLEFLQQVRILDPSANHDRIGDVLLDNGTIKAIGPTLPIPDSAVVLDGQGCVFGPGLTDLYSRSGEPGHEERETLESLLESAISGGFTNLNLLPNTSPPLDNSGQLTSMRQRVNSLSAIGPNVQFWGALTLNTAGQQLCEFRELEPHVTGFSDGKPVPAALMLRRILDYLQPLGKPIMLWPCDVDLTGNGTIRDGVNALRFGLPGIPSSAEAVPIAMILELLREIQTPVHLMRISTARAVELIAAAKSEGLPITASVTWQHLLYDTSDLQNYDPNFRLLSPLGNRIDRISLLQALKSGVIDAIAIDHSGYTYEEKTVAFGETIPGAIGFELALAELWNALVKSETLTALELWRSLSQRPMSCLSQTLQSIQPENLQSLILFNPNEHWSVTGQTLNCRSHNTHLLNQTIQGKVIKTWCS
jgi:dihydroorotase